ncbi:MAG: hypothetical protein ABR527_10835 [Gemmatimonadota bacterium]
MIDVDNGYHIWSDTYDREMADVFAIQEEIARAIVTELEPELVTAAIRIIPRRTSDPEAYRLYLQGRFLWSQRTLEATTRAIELFEAAIRADTTYALAYTGLADSYQSLRARGFTGHDVEPLDPGQRVDQLLRYAVAEVLLISAGAQVGEGEDRDRGGGLGCTGPGRRRGLRLRERVPRFAVAQCPPA